MKDTRKVVALAEGRLATMLSEANPEISPPTIATQTTFPKEHSNSCEHKDEWAGCPGIAFWQSVFTFFVEGFAVYGASIHWTAAFPVETVPTDANRPHPQPASRTPIAAGHERGPYLISENGNIVELDRVAGASASRVAEIG